MTSLEMYLKKGLKCSLEQYLKYGKTDNHSGIDVIVDDIIIDEETYLKIKPESFILEAKITFPLIPGTKYTYRVDSPNGEPRPGNQRHVHILGRKGNELFAMNVDGTAHDGSHNCRIPDEVATFLRGKGFTIPENNIIECISTPIEHVLVEAMDRLPMASFNDVVLSIAGIVRDSEIMQLIESNLEKWEIQCYSEFTGKGYNMIEMIDYTAMDCNFTTAKEVLIHTLDDYPQFVPDVMTICNGDDYNSNPRNRHLYIVGKRRL